MSFKFGFGFGFGFGLYAVNTTVRITATGSYFNKIGIVINANPSGGWHTVQFPDGTTKKFQTGSLAIAPIIAPIQNVARNIQNNRPGRWIRRLVKRRKINGLRSNPKRSPILQKRSPILQKRSPILQKRSLQKRSKKIKNIIKTTKNEFFIIGGRYKGLQCVIERETPKKYSIRLYQRDILDHTKYVLDTQVHLVDKAFVETKTKEESLCINDKTFVALDSLEEVDDLVHISGYCFDLDELVMYVKSDSFDNKNPHELSMDLFDLNNIKVYKVYPELYKALKKYIKVVEGKLDEQTIILMANLDLFYLIGLTGRICYWDHLNSHEKDNSSVFINSIKAISHLSEKINKLSKNDKNIFENLTLGQNSSISELIESADKGTSCIHGIGSTLTLIFIKYFIECEKRFPGLKYDSRKTGIYFIRFVSKDPNDPDNGLILFQNNTLKYTDDPSSEYYKTSESLLNKYFRKDIKTSLLTITKPTYSCTNDADMSTDDTVDEWSDIPEWRFIKIGEYCFDIIYLIKTITNQLNNSKNNAPYPLYPSNPFTRKIFTKNELDAILEKISDNNINISASMHYFLYMFPDKTDDQKLANSNSFMLKIIAFFEKHARYLRYYSGNEDDLINGEWVIKTQPHILNENLIFAYLNNFDLNALAQFKASTYRHKNTYYSFRPKPGYMDIWSWIKYT